MDFRERVLGRNKQRLAELVANDNVDEQEKLPISDYFRVVRVRNSPACLDLHLADGSFVAVPYSLVSLISFDPSEGIEISLANEKNVIISGRNLDKIYKYLTNFRVRLIKANIGNDTSDEAITFVENIEIKEV